MDWIFRGKVNKVLDCRSIDFTFDLGFSIKYRQEIPLSGYSVEDSLKAEAKNCLILLIGGHRVIVIPDRKDKVYEAKIYLYMPLKIQNCFEDVCDIRLQSVNKIMQFLGTKSFSTEFLKSVLPVNSPE